METFFEISSVEQLKSFQKNLNLNSINQRAISYYIKNWFISDESSNKAHFRPGRFLSRDRSTVLYGSTPVIFEGTNFWCRKPYLVKNEINKKASQLLNLVTRIRERNINSKILLIIVPEKDYLISRHIFKEDRFNKISNCFKNLSRALTAAEVNTVFDEPFVHHYYPSANDYDYPDSHLRCMDYEKIFQHSILSLNHDQTLFNDQYELIEDVAFGDLARKLDDNGLARFIGLAPSFSKTVVNFENGMKSFGDPLGTTWQEFSNTSPIIDESVCILGDSHSSIFDSRKLTYFLANTFRSTRFEWNPCGTRSFPEKLNFDNIILEISARFVV